LTESVVLHQYIIVVLLPFSMQLYSVYNISHEVFRPLVDKI